MAAARRVLARQAAQGVKMRLLLVEDDRMIGESVADLLQDAGFAVDWVQRAGSAETALATHDYDLLILDLGLPDQSGLSLLRTLRSQGQNLPVIITTARDALTDRVTGLDAGADDYLVKPYEIEELLARIRAQRRRQAPHASQRLVWRDLALALDTHQAWRAGQPVTLTAREWAVLEPLARHPGALFSRAQLEEKLYSWSDDVSSNTVEVHIHGLRKKLGSAFIQNIRGLGYRIPLE